MESKNFNKNFLLLCVNPRKMSKVIKHVLIKFNEKEKNFLKLNESHSTLTK